MSSRWQQEISETVFDIVNQEADKLEMKRRQRRQAAAASSASSGATGGGGEESDEEWAGYAPSAQTDCIVEGEILKLGGPFLQAWQKRHLRLYPNRLEFYQKTRDGLLLKNKGVEVSILLPSYSLPHFLSLFFLITSLPG